MKKIISAILALTLVAALAGCSSKPPVPTTEATLPATETTEVTEAVTDASTEPAEETTGEAVDLGASADALAILENIWADYADEEKFPIAGGDFDANTFVMGAPGAIPMEYAASLMNTLLVPESYLAQADGAATMLHGMNGNIFSSGILHMAENTDMAAFAEELKTALKNNQWICGAPETMLLAVIDGCNMLISFGNGEIMASFQSHVEAVYPEAEILATDAIFE